MNEPYVVRTGQAYRPVGVPRRRALGWFIAGAICAVIGGWATADAIDMSRMVAAGPPYIDWYGDEWTPAEIAADDRSTLASAWVFGTAAAVLVGIGIYRRLRGDLTVTVTPVAEVDSYEEQLRSYDAQWQRFGQQAPAASLAVAGPATPPPGESEDATRLIGQVALLTPKLSTLERAVPGITELATTAAAAIGRVIEEAAVDAADHSLPRLVDEGLRRHAEVCRTAPPVYLDLVERPGSHSPHQFSLALAVDWAARGARPDQRTGLGIAVDAWHSVSGGRVDAAAGHFGKSEPTG